MRSLGRLMGTLIVVGLVTGCGRFSSVADDLARVRPPNLSGDKSTIEKLLDDAFRGFSGADDEARQLARQAGDDAFAAASSVDAIALRFPNVKQKLASGIRGTLCDLGRHYLTSDKPPDIAEMVRNNGIAELVPSYQIVTIAQDVQGLGAAYQRGVRADRIYWSARIGIECLLAGKSR